MTRIHGEFYETVGECHPSRDSPKLMLEAKQGDDGTVWVRLVGEERDGQVRTPLICDNLELL